MGSDIAGSLRVPAHFCGVYAHKPSFGVLPGRGHTPPSTPPLPYERDLTVIGPMARSSEDLSLMFKLLAEPDDTTLGIAYRLALVPPRHDDLAEYRVLVIDTHPLIPTAASVRSHIDEFASRIAQAGASVTRNSSLLPDQTEAARLYMRLLMSSLSASLPTEAYENMRVQAAALAVDDLSLSSERLRGAIMSHRDWLIADGTRARLRQRWRELFTEFDVVLCPVVPTPAFLHDQSPDQWRRTIEIDGGNYNYGDQLVWAGIASAPGLPSTVVPVGRSKDGLPIGVQILGPMYEDRTSLRFAELIERKFGGFEPPLLDMP
jgi:amidase